MEQVFDLSKTHISEQSDQQLTGRLALLSDSKVELNKTLNFVTAEIKTINAEMSKRKRSKE